MVFFAFTKFSLHFSLVYLQVPKFPTSTEKAKKKFKHLFTLIVLTSSRHIKIPLCFKTLEIPLCSRKVCVDIQRWPVFRLMSKRLHVLMSA